MDELGHSKPSETKDSGNIPVSDLSVPIDAHTSTITDEKEPDVDDDSVFTEGPVDRDNHDALDTPLEAEQISGEAIENYNIDISSNVLETVAQTIEGENFGNQRELDSEKASKLDSMEGPAKPNEDNDVGSIKPDTDIKSINTSKTNEEEFSEETDHQVSTEIQLRKSSQQSLE